MQSWHAGTCALTTGSFRQTLDEHQALQLQRNDIGQQGSGKLSIILSARTQYLQLLDSSQLCACDAHAERLEAAVIAERLAGWLQRGFQDTLQQRSSCPCCGRPVCSHCAALQARTLPKQLHGCLHASGLPAQCPLYLSDHACDQKQAVLCGWYAKEQTTGCLIAQVALGQR